MNEEMAKEPKEPTQVVTLRLPESLIKRLDRHAERMNDEMPGLDFSRIDAARSLLTRALDDAESTSKRRGSKT